MLLVACSALERVWWFVRPWKVFNHMSDLSKNLVVGLDLSVLQRVLEKKKMVPFPPSLPYRDLKGNLNEFV